MLETSGHAPERTWRGFTGLSNIPTGRSRDCSRTASNSLVVRSCRTVPASTSASHDPSLTGHVSANIVRQTMSPATTAAKNCANERF